MNLSPHIWSHIWSEILQFIPLDDLLKLRDHLKNSHIQLGFINLDTIRSAYINGLKRRKDKATIHLINLRDVVGGELEIDELEELYPGISQMMRRGDIIENVSYSGYRSQHVWFFDGNQVIGQYYEIDDYGTPPLEFKLVTEFPPGYWDGDWEWDLGNAFNAPPVNRWFIRDDSKFYWHHERVKSPIGSELVEDILHKIRHNLECKNLSYIHDCESLTKSSTTSSIAVASVITRSSSMVLYTIRTVPFHFITFEYSQIRYLLRICTDSSTGCGGNTKNIFIRRLHVHDKRDTGLINLLDQMRIDRANVLTDEW